MNSYYPAGGEGNEGRSKQGPRIIWEWGREREREREMPDWFRKRVNRDGNHIHFQSCLWSIIIVNWKEECLANLGICVWLCDVYVHLFMQTYWYDLGRVFARFLKMKVHLNCTCRLRASLVIAAIRRKPASVAHIPVSSVVKATKPIRSF